MILSFCCYLRDIDTTAVLDQPYCHLHLLCCFIISKSILLETYWLWLFSLIELQTLRQEKELTDSEIASLELEKNAICKVIFSVLVILNVVCKYLVCVNVHDSCVIFLSLCNHWLVVFSVYVTASYSSSHPSLF